MPWRSPPSAAWTRAARPPPAGDPDRSSGRPGYGGPPPPSRCWPGRSRAVLSQQGHDLPRAQLEAHMVQGLDAGEGLAYLLHGDDDVVHLLTCLSWAFCPVGLSSLDYRLGREGEQGKLLLILRGFFYALFMRWRFAVLLFLCNISQKAVGILDGSLIRDHLAQTR